MVKVNKKSNSENKKNVNSIVGRADPDFIKEMRELAKFRYIQNLEKKEPTLSEMTRLLRRTDAWKTASFELKTKPRRENI